MVCPSSSRTRRCSLVHPEGPAAAPRHAGCRAIGPRRAAPAEHWAAVGRHPAGLVLPVGAGADPGERPTSLGGGEGGGDRRLGTQRGSLQTQHDDGHVSRRIAAAKKNRRAFNVREKPASSRPMPPDERITETAGYRPSCSQSAKGTKSRSQVLHTSARAEIARGPGRVRTRNTTIPPKGLKNPAFRDKKLLGPGVYSSNC